MFNAFTLEAAEKTVRGDPRVQKTNGLILEHDPAINQWKATIRGSYTSRDSKGKAHNHRLETVGSGDTQLTAIKAAYGSFLERYAEKIASE